MSRFLAVASLLLLLAVSVTYGQSTYATVTGTVTDPTGAAVPNVTVEVIHVATNYHYSGRTNDAGQYTIANLREGEYTLKASASGFADFMVKSFTLANRDVRRIDPRLQVGSVQSSVDVVGGATLIETETARIADTKDREVMKDLPLVERSVWSYFTLSPAVSKAPNGWFIRFAGSRTGQSEVSIDGVSLATNDGTSLVGPLMDWTESVQEVRVESANNSAEFGPLGSVSITTRAGTNELHGSAFDFYQSPIMMARNPFSATRGGSTGHRLGGSIGGPVYIPKVYDGHNKTFFLFSDERMEPTMVNQYLTPGVPLQAWRSGDFSALAPIRNPFNNNAPFPNNIIPATSINPVSKQLQDQFYPLPNYGNTSVFSGANYREMKQRPIGPESDIAVRIDHRFSDKAWIYGRYNNVGYASVPWEDNLPTIGQRYAHRTSENANISQSYMFRPDLMNEFRWGLTFDSYPAYGPTDGNALVQKLGLQGLAPNLPQVNGLPNISFTGLGIQGLSESQSCLICNRQTTNTFQEHLSWFHGRHSVKAGFVIMNVSLQNQPMPSNLFGSASFSKQYTGFTYADFLLGIPTTVSRGYAPPLQDLTRRSYNMFVQDDFKITPKLTVNLGLRYEYQPGWNEAHGLMSGFNLADGKIVVPDAGISQVSPLVPGSYVAVETASQAGWNPNSLVHADRNNFAPRIGVAYRPWGNNTVIRAGYGIFYDIAPYQPITAGVPFAVSEPSYTNSATNPAVIFPQIFPAAGVAGPSRISIPQGINPNVKVPYSMQYNFTVEHQMWNTGFRASYIGTNTREGLWLYNANQPLPGPGLYINKPRLFPQYPDIYTVANGAGHQYNALTLQAERQMKSGLYFQTSYTLARDIGDLDRLGSPENSYDRTREIGVMGDPPTNKWTTNLVYQLPFGRGKRFLSGGGRFLNALAGGWHTSIIWVMSTGEFLTPSWTGQDPAGTAYTSNSTPATVTLRPDQLANANIANPAVNQWFNPAAFGAPGAGRFGTSARGVIKGPGMQVMDAGMFKEFAIHERLKLRWELTASNVLNHPNWGNPATNISSLGTVGQITGTNGDYSYDSPGPRQGRMALHLEW